MRCVWVHNGDDTLVEHIGAYAGENSLEGAMAKMRAVVEAYSSKF